MNSCKRYPLKKRRLRRGGTWTARSTTDDGGAATKLLSLKTKGGKGKNG